ncbi:MAG: T9SS type A sorting domain-containing protein [Chitinophagaceae bacterium]
MRRFTHLLLVSVAAIAVADTAFAQNSFYSTPKDTIVATLPLEVKGSYMFRQFANSGNILHLAWQQIKADVPAQWEINLCDNGTCFPNLPFSGVMNDVPVGDYGLLNLDVKPKINYGTAIVQYAVWDAGLPALKDTLTWIIHSSTTGISTAEQNQTLAYVSGKTLYINNLNGTQKKLVLVDMTGRKVLQKEVLFQEGSFDVSALSSGMYVLLITADNYHYTQKIIVGAY